MFTRLGCAALVLVLVFTLSFPSLCSGCVSSWGEIKGLFADEDPDDYDNGQGDGDTGEDPDDPPDDPPACTIGFFRILCALLLDVCN
jgi:hypothetical protein